MLARLSRLDRFLPLWIALAMVGGLVLGTLVPGLNDQLDRLQVGTVSACRSRRGCCLMMYPVLAKVRYEDIGRMTDDGVGNGGSSAPRSCSLGGWAGLDVRARVDVPRRPARLPHRGDHRRAGALHRDGARVERHRLGDRERAAILVVFNALFQVLAYSVLGYFYLTLLPGWLGLTRRGSRSGSGRSPHRADLPRHPAHRRLPHPADRPPPPRPRLVRAAASSRASHRSPCTACCSRSCCCSRSRATRSPRNHSTSC